MNANHEEGTPNYSEEGGNMSSSDGCSVQQAEKERERVGEFIASLDTVLDDLQRRLFSAVTLTTYLRRCCLGLEERHDAEEQLSVGNIARTYSLLLAVDNICMQVHFAVENVEELATKILTDEGLSPDYARNWTTIPDA